MTGAGSFDEQRGTREHEKWLQRVAIPRRRREEAPDERVPREHCDPEADPP